MRESTAIHHKLGYSPQSAVNRVIKDGSQFDSLFPKPDGKKVLLKKDGEVDETVQFMKQIVNDCNYQTKKIAEKIAVRKKDGSLDEKASVQSLWNFVVDYIKYNIEAGEQLRTPAKTWYDAQVCARQHPGVNDPQHSADCDCMSIFCGCVLLNWGIPFSFRITGYSDVLGICHGYQHVYTIAHCKGENVICDPVYHLFNAEKPFEIQKTYAMSLNGCDIYALSGIPDEDEELGVTEYYETPDGGLGVLNGRAKRKKRRAERKKKKKARKEARKEKRAAKKEKRKAKRDMRKAKKRGDKQAYNEAKKRKLAAKDKIRAAKDKIDENRTGIAKAMSKGVKFLKKGTMLAVRAPFLLLMRVNFRGMATKFSQNPEALKRFCTTWRRVFGGSEKKLKKAIEKGKNKKAVFGKGKGVKGLIGLEYELENLGNVLENYGVITERTLRNEGLGFTDGGVGEAMALASSVIAAAMSVFEAVKAIIPSNKEEAEEQGLDAEEVDEDTKVNYRQEDIDEGEESEEESEESEEMEGLGGYENGFYFVGEDNRIYRRHPDGMITVLGALNGKKKAARKAKRAAKKAARKAKRAAKKEAKKAKKAARKAGMSRKEAKKAYKAAKKEIKSAFKSKKKEIKSAFKEAKKSGDTEQLKKIAENTTFDVKMPVVAEKNVDVVENPIPSESGIVENVSFDNVSTDFVVSPNTDTDSGTFDFTPSVDDVPTDDFLIIQNDEESAAANNQKFDTEDDDSDNDNSSDYEESNNEKEDTPITTAGNRVAKKTDNNKKKSRKGLLIGGLITAVVIGGVIFFYNKKGGDNGKK